MSVSKEINTEAVGAISDENRIAYKQCFETFGKKQASKAPLINLCVGKILSVLLLAAC